PMVVMVLAILWNAGFDYALIFGHFGFPEMGLYGAGIASASSNIFSFVAMLAVCLIVPALKRYRILHRLQHADWTCFAELFRLGLPIAITIPSLTFMVPLGIGQAATVRVGLAAGAGDGIAARRAGFTAIAMAVVFM